EDGHGVVGQVGQGQPARAPDAAAVAPVVERHHAEALSQGRVGGEPVGVGGHAEAVEEQHRGGSRRGGVVPDEGGPPTRELERPTGEQDRSARQRPLEAHSMPTSSTLSVAPVGDWYSTVSPTFLPTSASPSGEPG